MMRVVPTALAETEAADALARYWAGPVGGLALPVDPVFIARQMGAEVWITDLDDGVSGVLIAEPGQQTAIHLSSTEAVVRQRYTCAHEIGHLVRRRAAGVTRFGFIDRRDHLSASGTDPEESWANRFAAALLMPASMLRDSPQRDPTNLAPVYGVSVRAMSIRLTTLGLVAR